ncbi:FAD dependent oxidoreductase superfamily [Teratosphaeria nubilosa]|uniref:FAD dependent oxidoreductase superfamily n=1 Tax=Teratosphaeria nubilosa TaxID=161662 RepID=A0A6G1LAH5_9PEZI|nr:FAD dependent oxidoreductase superfamily [Teratosphaeria nubilosa]
MAGSKGINGKSVASSVNGTASNLRLPVPNATKPFWHTKLHHLADHRTTPDLPSEADVVIIGSGYAGAGVSYNLAKSPRSPNSIVVLEAREVCSAASGKNGGHLRPDLYGHIPTYIDRYGAEAGKQWAEYEIAHVPAIKKLIEDEDIDCNFTLSRSTDCWCNEQAAKKIKATWDLMKSYNFSYLEDVHFVYGARAAAVSGIKDAKAMATYTAATLWPYKFICGLLQRAIATGKVNLQTHTPATGIRANEDATWTIETPRGSIRASKVVHASNAYISSLLPEYSKSIVPCKGICCHVQVPEGKTAPYLTNSYVVRDQDTSLSYLIPREDGGIIVGGDQYHFKPDRGSWYNNTDDSTLIEASKNFYDGYMQRTFRGWEDSGASVEQIWTGIMGYSFDSLPHVGTVPSKEGQFVLAGFNGHGMPVIWLASKAIAEMVADGKTFEETGMPWIAKTTEERLKKAQDGPEGGDILA